MNTIQRLLKLSTEELESMSDKDMLTRWGHLIPAAREVDKGEERSKAIDLAQHVMAQFRAQQNKK